MKIQSILVWIVVMTANTSVYSADWQVYWVPGENIPGTWEWNIYPSHFLPPPPLPPGTVPFSGPTGVFGNSCYAAYDFGGIPTITIDPKQKTIELWFKPPAPGMCPAVYLPVCGLNGWFGPLSEGDWIFYSNQIPYPYSFFPINIHVDPPTLTILYPNGGERLHEGSTYTIRWEDSRSEGYCIGNYLLHYSKDDGNSWIPVIPFNISTCSFDWRIPSSLSYKCLIRITDADDPNITDTSDDPFYIVRCLLPIPGDWNGDCYLDFDDFAILAAAWNGGGGTNMNDLANLVESWLDCHNALDPSCSN